MENHIKVMTTAVVIVNIFQLLTQTKTQIITEMMMTHMVGTVSTTTRSKKSIK